MSPMAPEAAEVDLARELRLEGWKLVVAGGAIVALLLGAFQLGRAVERWGGGASAVAPPDPLAGVEREPEEAGEKLTFFDTLSGTGQQAEPKREAATSSPTTALPPTAASAGPWFVQVFVGRDRTAAEEVVKTLRGKGYPVKTESVREGASGSLYKVRVGGFATREAADASAARLHGDGQASTWVVKTGG